MTAACSSCHAPIVWAISTSGKPIPLDAEPDPTGNLLAVDAHGEVLPADMARLAVLRGRPMVTVARRGPRTMDPDLPRWRTHFATCPDADRHRAPRVRTTENTLPL